MSLLLPLVRTRRLPPPGALRWRETGDIPSALVVLIVCAVGMVPAFGGAYRAASAAAGIESTLLITALALFVSCVFAVLAAVAEFTHLTTVFIDKDTVHVRTRGFGRLSQYSEALHRYRGLFLVERTRRLFIRNQDHPITGRRAPVSEFVIVLRHGDDNERGRARDIELFRAQPSLQTLLAMHSMQDAASGRASAANAAACVELASSYRQALTRLCEQLEKPVLIADAQHELQEWPLMSLDDWLQPPPEQPPTTSGTEQ